MFVCHINSYQGTAPEEQFYFHVSKNDSVCKFQSFLVHSHNPFPMAYEWYKSAAHGDTGWLPSWVGQALLLLWFSDLFSLSGTKPLPGDFRMHFQHHGPPYNFNSTNRNNFQPVSFSSGLMFIKFTSFCHLNS